METTSAGVLQSLNELNQDAVVTLFFLSIGVMVTIVFLSIVVSRLVTVMHKNRLEANLKESLIEQGFSADEIAMIVEASAGGKKKDS